MSRWGLHLLGLILLYSGCGQTAHTIDVSIHAGDVGQVVSYNYPFIYNNTGINQFNYRIFSNTSAKSICMKFHRFDMRYGGTLTIKSLYGSGTYYKDGKRQYADSVIFPRDVWSNDFFCVPLKYGWDYLEVTFTQRGENVRGFQFDYWAMSTNNRAQVYPTLQQNFQKNEATVTDKFVCYDRKNVRLEYTCDGGTPDCDDSTDETFAHAQCTDTLSRPLQKPGIWACNFDSGSCSHDMSYYSWRVGSSVSSDEEGPMTDHTHSSSGQRGKFVYTDYDGWGNGASLMFHPLEINSRPTHDQDYCLSFWYFMGGNDPGRLSVQRLLTSKPLWQRIGSYGYKWLHGQVYLKHGDDHAEIEFFAKRGSQDENMIALDDISVLPGLCPYTDGSLTSPGWDFDDCDTYTSANNSIRCNNKCITSVVISPMIASGKCLVLSVRFPSRHRFQVPDVRVYQLTLGEDSRFLAVIRQPSYSNYEETKKFRINSNNPFQIKLILRNYEGSTIIDNIYVVDSYCDDISLGSCDPGEFYCSPGECIASYLKCDDNINCGNGLDERDCTHTTLPGVTVASGLIGACIFILLGLTCILYSINKKSTQRAQEARNRRDEETRGQMFLVEGANPGFPFDDPDNLPPSYNDCVTDGVVAPRGTTEGEDTADNTSLPPYDDFLTGSFVELNPITLKPVNQTNA